MKRLTERFPKVLKLSSLSHLFHWAWEAQRMWGSLQKGSGAALSDLDLALRMLHSEQFICHMAKIHIWQWELASWEYIFQWIGVNVEKITRIRGCPESLDCQDINVQFQWQKNYSFIFSFHRCSKPLCRNTGNVWVPLENCKYSTCTT